MSSFHSWSKIFLAAALLIVMVSQTALADGDETTESKGGANGGGGNRTAAFAQKETRAVSAQIKESSVHLQGTSRFSVVARVHPNPIIYGQNAAAAADCETILREEHIYYACSLSDLANARGLVEVPIHRQDANPVPTIIDVKAMRCTLLFSETDGSPFFALGLGAASSTYTPNCDVHLDYIDAETGQLMEHGKSQRQLFPTPLYTWKSYKNFIWERQPVVVGPPAVTYAK
jgi:hypothetical protein